MPALPQLAATVQVDAPGDSAVSLDMQWSVPSAADHANTVAAFSVVLDPHTDQPVLCWTGDESDQLAPGWDSGWSNKLELSELEEGLYTTLVQWQQST